MIDFILTKFQNLRFLGPFPTLLDPYRQHLKSVKIVVLYQFTVACIENFASKVEVWGLWDGKKVQDCDYVFGSSTTFQRRKEWIWESRCGQVSVRLHEIFPIQLDAFCLSTKQNRTNLVVCIRLVRLSSVIEYTSSINQTHRNVPVLLCSITEPIEQQSDRFGSIRFDWFLVRFRSIDYAGLLKLP